MDTLPRQKVITFLKERYTRLKEVGSFLRTLPTEELPTNPSKHPELVGVWISYVENEKLYTQKMLKAIQSGEYVFKLDKNKGVVK